MPYDIEVENVEPLQVAAVRLETNRSQIGEDIGRGFSMLMGAMGAASAHPAGAPLVVYHSVLDEFTHGEIEICVPVAATVTSDSGVYTRDLEGGSVATTIHRGPYPELATAYGVVMGWISEHGYEIAGPPREIYLNDPQQVAPEDLLTRVEFPVFGVDD